VQILDVVREICLLVGFLMFGYGLDLIYRPAMFIVCGLMIIYLGFPPREGGD